MHKNKALSDQQITDGDYRGPQQKLPGSPTKTTGVPNKNYRGPQQIVKKFILQSCKFFALDGVSLYCYVLYVVVNNNRNREGRGEQIRMSDPQIPLLPEYSSQVNTEQNLEE